MNIIKFKLQCPCAWVLCAESLQSCLTLCDPMDCSLPGCSVHGILQAAILKWVAMPSARGSSWSRDQTCVSCASLYWWDDSLLPSHQGISTNKFYWNTTANPGSLNIHGCFYPLSYRSKIEFICDRDCGTHTAESLLFIKTGSQEGGDIYTHVAASLCCAS